MDSGSAPEPQRFLIQIDPEGLGGPSLQSDAGTKAIEGSQENLEAAARLARNAGLALKGTFNALAPTKGTVEFSVTFEAEAGIPVLGKGKAGASLTITLEWEHAGA